MTKLEYDRLLDRATELIRERFRAASLAKIDPALLREVIANGPDASMLGPEHEIKVESDMRDRVLHTKVTVTGLSAYLLRLADAREGKEDP